MLSTYQDQFYFTTSEMHEPCFLMSAKNLVSQQKPYSSGDFLAAMAKNITACTKELCPKLHANYVGAPTKSSKILSFN